MTLCDIKWVQISPGKEQGAGGGWWTQLVCTDTISPRYCRYRAGELNYWWCNPGWHWQWEDRWPSACWSSAAASSLWDWWVPGAQWLGTAGSKPFQLSGIITGTCQLKVSGEDCGEMAGTAPPPRACGRRAWEGSSLASSLSFSRTAIKSSTNISYSLWTRQCFR